MLLAQSGDPARRSWEPARNEDATIIKLDRLFTGCYDPDIMERQTFAFCFFFTGTRHAARVGGSFAW